MLRPFGIADLPRLRELAGVASAEGFRFLDRFLDDLVADRVQLDAAGEFFVAHVEGERLVSIGGVTPDPYVDDVGVGRLRHVYVHPSVRRAGIGRALVEHLEERARSCYAWLQLRTDTETAARFYERLGYLPIRSESATHRRPLCGGLRATLSAGAGIE